MQIFSTNDERKELLRRLRSAPNTPEIESAIRIVEEAMQFADLRDLIVKLFETYSAPGSFEQIVESRYIHPEMRPFSNAINDLYELTRLQRFKKFYEYDEESNIDEDGYTII